MSRKITVVILHVMLIALVFIYGYLEELASLNGLSEKQIRAGLIILVLVHALLLNFRPEGRSGRTSGIFILFFIFFSYGFVVAAIQGELLSAVSPAMRLLSFVLLAMWIYALLIAKPEQAHHAMYLFFTVCASIIILQLLFDYAFDRSVFMNGGHRYYGSVGSPIGFAASILVVQIGIIYRWLVKPDKLLFLLTVGLSWAIIMTGTRSISFFSLLLISTAIILKTKGWAKFASLIAVPLIILFILILGSESTFVTRFTSVLIDSELDNSSLFRVFILESYTNAIDLSQLIFGIGLGQFHGWFLGQTGFDNVAPHFEFLWVLSEFGIAGSLLYVLVFALLLIKYLTRFRFHSQANNFLFISVFLTHQIFLQVANPFYFYQFYVPFALLFGTVIFHFDPLPIRAFGSAPCLTKDVRCS